MAGLTAYIFRSKRGVAGTLITAAAAMLITAVVTVIPTVREYVQFIRRGGISEESLSRFNMTEDEFVQMMFRDVPVSNIEVIALAAAGLWFLFLCAGALRFGTANGVSRRSVIGTTLISLPVTAALVTALNYGICRLLISKTIFFSDITLYITFNRNEWEYPKNYDEIAETAVTTDFALREAVLFFAAAVVLMSAVCCLYGLFRKHGTYGVTVGVLAMILPFGIVSLLINSEGNIGSRIKALYFAAEPAVFTVNGEYLCMNEPKAAAWLITAGVCTAVMITVYVLCIRRLSVRSAED